MEQLIADVMGKLEFRADRIYLLFFDPSSVRGEDLIRSVEVAQRHSDTKLLQGIAIPCLHSAPSQMEFESTADIRRWLDEIDKNAAHIAQ